MIVYTGKYSGLRKCIGSQPVDEVIREQTHGALVLWFTTSKGLV